MKSFAASVTFLFSLLLLSFSAMAQGFDPAQYVNPMIGTGGHGHVFPGPTMPFGMVQLSPDEETSGWDWCSGYNYSSKTIMGFSYTHLSGTGAMDYGDVLFMPTVGEVRLIPGTDDNPSVGYRSWFSHSSETALPGYYSVLLQRYNVKVELTATDRCGLQKYTFPASDSSNVILDLQHGIGNTCTGGWVKIVGDRWIEGMRRSHGWASDRYVYFVAEFSKPFGKFGTADGASVNAGSRSANGDSVKAYVTFKTTKDEPILVRVGISAVSLDGAKKNLAAEMRDFDFPKYKEAAHKAWNTALGKIRVEGGTHSDLVTFYTALYHTMMDPNLFQDVDGKYYGMDHKIHTAKGFTNYTVFSLWDVFRAEMPLMSIIEPKLYDNFVKSILQEYKEAGLLPVWPLAGNETYTMIGYPSVPVIFDAYMKGFRNYNIDTAFAAMKHSADLDWQGLRYYKERGYIPADKEDASVSKTMEYAYDDWCIAQMAKKLGKMNDYRQFNQRSLFYRNVFDSSTGFVRGKLADGRWITPFDPFAATGQYTEANAWQYTFFVPQDIGGLMKLFGGKEAFADKLDSLFNAPSELAGRPDPDITGLIGQDAQGDEQSHHVGYLYDYAGQPWKTQNIVRKIMTVLYTDKVDGLCGNDDCGQMSAWYVLSALGFYPVTPGQNLYAIGSPLFRKATIETEKGKAFVIEAEGASDEAKYIQSASFNGKPFHHPYVSQEQLVEGGTLRFKMAETPNKEWGLDNAAMFSMEPDGDVVPMVSLNSTGEIFYDSAAVELSSPKPEAVIRYTVNGKEPGPNSPIYKSPVTIRKACTLKAVAFLGKNESMTTSASFLKSLYPPATYKYPFSMQYNGGGAMALTDGRVGTTNYQGGQWQGFEGSDLDAVIDLTKEKTLNEVSAGFLEDTPVWIFLPEYVEYYVSQDGRTFTKVAHIANDVDARQHALVLKHFTAKLNGVKARYLKIVAKNIGICPPWHAGAGYKAWIFVDEVKIK